MQFFGCLFHFLTSLSTENGALVEKILPALYVLPYTSSDVSTDLIRLATYLSFLKIHLKYRQFVEITLNN